MANLDAGRVDRSVMPRTLIAIVAMLVLVPGLEPASTPATVPVSHVEPTKLETHWELLAQSPTGIASTTTYNIRRGVLPGSTSKFDPAPTATLEVVARTTAIGSGSGWYVELLDAAGNVMASVPFGFADGDTAYKLKTGSLSWPSSNQALHRVRARTEGTTPGTLDLRKAYIKIHQEGTIKKTVGRVPIASRQDAITSTSWSDLADVVYYRHSTSDFDPAPVVRLQGTGSVPSNVDGEIRLVASDGTPVPSSQLTIQSLVSNQTGALALSHGEIYRLQVIRNPGGFAVDPKWDLYSAEVIFEQSTSDEHGLKKTVGFYPSVTAPTDLIANNVNLDYMFRAPASNTYSGEGELHATLRRSAGASVGVRLYNRTAGGNVGNEASTNSSSYVLRTAGVPPAPPAAHWIDTRSGVPTSAAGRVSSSLYRVVYELRDLHPPTIGAPFGAVPGLFSPNDDDVNDETELQAGLTDASPNIDWKWEIKDANMETVRTLTGTATGVSLGSVTVVSVVWDGRNSTGTVVPDGEYQLVFSATDPEENTATQSTSVIVDSTPPQITGFIATPDPFRPEGGGDDDSTTFEAGISDASAVIWTLRISDDEGSLVRDLAAGSVASVSEIWDGSDDSEAIVEDGTYTAVLKVTDAAGNSSTATRAVSKVSYADPTSVEFTYTGAAQTWTVPEGVSSIRVDAWGAQGGSGNYGGPGGRVTATIAVTPGEVLQVNVGGHPSGNSGGFNGGGNGGTGAFGGGGASDVRRGGVSLSHRVVVAGGGGGAAAGAGTVYGSGGSGGGLIGGTGQYGSRETDLGGQGGTQSAGGAGGTGYSGGGAGSLGVGGNATSPNGPGGGGGGGFYGGGAGAGCNGSCVGGGGGGGSSFTTSEASVVSHQQGVRTGHGRVEISYPPVTLAAPASPSGSATFSHTGSSQTWTVPPGLHSIQVDAWGAQGGGANWGGLGGRVTATLQVTPGEVLHVNVGGHPNGFVGGFNGGGSLSLDRGAFGGGGASDIRRGGVTLAHRILVAGGGAGAASGATTWSGAGGSGGGLTAGAGDDGKTASCPRGHGGTQTSGGAAGLGYSSGHPGSLGKGGDANVPNWPGGAGGGGFYGGGGGAGCNSGGGGGGGGGGSSYTTPLATGVVHQRGVHRGHGLIQISYPPQLPPEPATPAADLVTFTHTGGSQWWTVPDGVRAVRVAVAGAKGGGGNGGKGGSVEAVLLVTPGEELQIIVGGQATSGTGGFGGGGGAGAMGGGGASDVRRGGVTLDDRVVVAGGGGGQASGGTPGGVGGGLIGGKGQDGPSLTLGGEGGTQSSGGAGGTGYSGGSAGSVGRGGNAGSPNWPGGGGGGGLYGGGGGAGCNACGAGGGGGGGSSSVDPTRAFEAFTISGVTGGHGSVEISWPVELPVDRAFGFDSYGEYVHNVHLGSGNFVESFTDVEISTAGPDLALTRTYNSLDTRVGLFGKGWTSTYEMRADLDEPSGDVEIIYPNGRRELHKSKGDGTFQTPKSYVSTLTEESGGGWRLTHKDKTVHVFNANGRLVSIADGYGRELELTYASGKLTQVKDAASNRSLSLSYDGDLVSSVQTSSVSGPGYSGPLTWNYVYNGERLTKVCDARDPSTSSGKCTVYSYTSGRLTKITRPKGNDATRLSYRSDGKVRWSENGVGDRVRFTYGSGITQVKDPRGFTTSYFFDPMYRTTRLVDPLGATTVYEYDDKGFRSLVVDANGNRTTMTHDARGNMLSQRNGAGDTTWFSYSGDDLVARRDPRSSSASDNTYKTTFTYNSQGDALTETGPPTTEYPSGVEKSFTYTAGTENFGWGVVPPGLKRSESPGRGTIWFEYDGKGDLRRRIDPSGLTTEFSYDALGRRTSTKVIWESGSAETTTTYDQLGNVLQETEPAVVNEAASPSITHRKRTTYVYDDNGNRTRMTVADIGGSGSPTPTRETLYAFDDADRLWKITDPEGGVTSRTFDANGNVRDVTDAEGRTYRSIYDAANNLTRIRLLGFVDDPIAGTTPRNVILKEFRYDHGGRKIAEIDPRPGTGGLAGQATPGVSLERWFAYDKADRLVSVTLKNFKNRPGVTPAFRDIVLEAYTYDKAGNAIIETTGGGKRAITNVFDQASRRQSATLQMGAVDRVSEFDYDELGNITRTTIRPSNDTAAAWEERSVYDDEGRLTSSTIENGSTDLVTTYTYDQRGLRLSTVDPRGNLSGADPADFRTDYAYDPLGRPTLTTYPPVTVEEGGGSPSTQRPVEKVGYDTVGNPTITIDERGNATTRTYDRLDRLTRVDHPSYTPPGGSALTPSETFTYDAVGNLVAQQDRRGETTDYTFDARNRVVRQRDPLVTGESARGVVRFEYDDAGNRTAEVDQTGARVEYAYDDLARVRTRNEIVRQDAPAGTFTTLFDYDDLDNPTFRSDPAGVTHTVVFNAASEATSITDALGKATTYGYDAAGRQISIEDPLGRAAVFVYDPAGRRTATEYRTGVTGLILATEYASYDAAGNQTAARSARSTSESDDAFKTSFVYDALDRLTSVTTPVDSSTSHTATFGYDSGSNLTRLTDGRNNATIYTWNAWGLAESTIEPSTPGQTAAADRTFTASYDAGGLPVAETIPGVTLSRSFDELGRLTGESGSGSGITAASRSFGYDLAGRRIAWSHPDGTVTAVYDDRGLLLSTSVPGGSSDASSFQYDAAGRMIERTDAAGTTSFTYTSRGELDTITDPLTGVTLDYSWNDASQPSGVSYSGTTTARAYTYDDRGWLATDSLADGGVLYATSYDYDADGNLETQTITASGNPAAGAHSYTYDRSGKLASWTAPGGPTVDYVYDGSGNRTQAGPISYTFDARNRLTAEGADAWSWTPRGTLATLTRAGTPTSVEHDALGRLIGFGSASYSYDALDRVAARGSEAFTYAGVELDPVAHGTSSYGRSPAGGLVSLEKGSTAAVAGRNRHGDLIWLADASGAVTDTRVWEPYGKVAGATGSTAPEVGFQSDYTDPASGMVWMGARWYEPTSAAFTARDSVFGLLATPVSLNRYTYAQGDPLEFFDPDGRWGWSSITRPVVGFVQGVYNTVVRPVVRAVASVGQRISSAAATAARSIGHAGRRAAVATAQRVQRMASGSLATLATGARALGSCLGENARACATAAFVAAGAVACPACAAVGAAVGAGISTVTCDGDASCVARGALTGAAASVGFAGAARLGLGAVASGAVAGLVGEGAGQAYEGEWDPARLAFAGLAGGTVAKASGLLVQGIRRAAPAIRNQARTIGRRLATEQRGSIGAPGRGSARGPSLRVHEPASLTNAQARAFYLEGERGIASLADDLALRGVSAKERALHLIQTRNALRSRTRDLMRDRELAAMLERTDPNLALNQLVARAYREKGLVGDELWDYLAASASRSRPSVNELFGLN